jgi:peptidoglycan/LPS O-acetylase OafA/YrhL
MPSAELELPTKLPDVCVTSVRTSEAPRSADTEAHAGETYVPALDGLRFVAFSFVFLHHAPLTQSTLIGRFGWAGVDLFLCLSGFLLTRLLLLERARRGHVSLRNFYIRRCLRIWPLYYLMLFVGFVAVPMYIASVARGNVAALVEAFRARDYVVPYAAFLGNWAVAQHGFPPNPALSPLWTISLEEQFYLFLPFVIAWSGNRATLMRVTALLFAVGGISRGVIAHYDASYLFATASTFARVDSFAAGMLVALLPASAWRVLQRPAAGVVLVLVGALAAWGVTSLPPANHTGPHLVLLYWLVDLTALTVLVATLRQGELQRLLSYGPFVYLGKISYGLYVCHLLVLWRLQIGRTFLGVTLEPGTRGVLRPAHSGAAGGLDRA